MMACEIIEKPDVIEFAYVFDEIEGLETPPPITSVIARNAVNGYVYFGDLGAPLGRDECLRLAEWLIRQARQMGEKP
jgi:hypothetical protein